MLVGDGVFSFEFHLGVVVGSKNDHVLGDPGGVDGKIFVGDTTSGTPGGVKIEDAFFGYRFGVYGGRVIDVTRVGHRRQGGSGGWGRLRL